MSEAPQEYVTDALEMMGILEPKQIVTEVSGFIPVFEVVLHHYKDYMTALVFGRMWQYCGMSDGVCKASLDRIGKDIEVSAVTVMRHAEKLVADGYLIDTTPDRRNAPHIYMDGRKVEMKSRFTAGMTINKATVIKSNASVINSQLIKQDNTNIKEIPADAVSEIIQSANKKVDAILEYEKDAQNSGTWQGREFIQPHILKYADWWNSQTGQTMKGKINKEWIKAFTAWHTEGVTVQDLQEAYNHTIAWKKIISRPSEITSTAAAIHALPKPTETQQSPKIKDGSGYV